MSISQENGWSYVHRGFKVTYEIEDVGKRVSDIVNGKITAHPFEEIQRSWMAFMLSNGDSDGELYPSMGDARRHQIGDDQQYAYISFRNCLGGMEPGAARVFMTYARAVYDAGGRMPDPDRPITQQSQLVMPLGREVIGSQLRGLFAKSGKTAEYYRGSKVR